MSLISSLVGKFLIAMPNVKDDFKKSIILTCGHDEKGTVGLIINRKIPSLYLDDLLVRLNIPLYHHFPKRVPLYSGGSMDMGRGFVLHSNDYDHEQTIEITSTLSLTASLDILKRIAVGRGPKHHLLALGYTNWESGQLEAEIKENKWLLMENSNSFIFKDSDHKWDHLVNSIGSQGRHLSLDTGQC